MPIIKSAIKRAKQALVHRERNQATKKDMKTAVKSFQVKPTAQSLGSAQSAIDKAVKKNVLNARTAARRKASLAKAAKAAGVKLANNTKKAAKPAAKTVTKKATVATKSPANKKKAAPKKSAATKASAKKTAKPKK